MGGGYCDAVQVRALVGQVLVGDLAAVFVHRDHSVPGGGETERDTEDRGEGSRASQRSAD